MSKVTPKAAVTVSANQVANPTLKATLGARPLNCVSAASMM